MADCVDRGATSSMTAQGELPTGKASRGGEPARDAGYTWPREASGASDAVPAVLLLPHMTRDTLLEARAAIEVHAAELAARRATEADLQKLRATLDHARAEASHGLPSIETSLAFHLSLVSAAHNRVLERALQAVRALLHRSIAQTRASRPESSVEVIALHERVYQAVASRQPLRARAEMVEHLRCSRERWARISRLLAEGATCD